MYLKFLNSSSHWRIRDQLYAHPFGAEHGVPQHRKRQTSHLKKEAALNAKRPAIWQGVLHYKKNDRAHRANTLPATRYYTLKADTTACSRSVCCAI